MPPVIITNEIVVSTPVILITNVIVGVPCVFKVLIRLWCPGVWPTNEGVWNFKF